MVLPCKPIIFGFINGSLHYADGDIVHEYTDRIRKISFGCHIQENWKSQFTRFPKYAMGSLFGYIDHIRWVDDFFCLLAGILFSV
jgi:hypothetical protein